MKKCLFICFVGLLSCLHVFSQTDEPAKVTGKVLSYYGDPIEKAEVKFYLLEKEAGKYVSSEGRFIKSGFTDEKGEYKITGLPWGEYRIEAIASGFPRSEVWRFYLWRSAERVLDLGLKFGITHGFPQIEIRGKIQSTDKTTISDATVTLINAFDTTEIKQIKTDKSGKYKIEFIQPGQYIIYVSKTGFSAASSSFLINIVNGNFPQTETSKTVDFQLTSLSKTKTNKNK